MTLLSAELVRILQEFVDKDLNKWSKSLNRQVQEDRPYGHY